MNKVFRLYFDLNNIDYCDYFDEIVSQVESLKYEIVNFSVYWYIFHYFNEMIKWNIDQEEFLWIGDIYSQLSIKFDILPENIFIFHDKIIHNNLSDFILIVDKVILDYAHSFDCSFMKNLEKTINDNNSFLYVID